MPDVPPVERTAEELAADAAEGMQWLASAIIAGAGKQEYNDTGAAYLHGRNVNGWIYAAPDGSRWLVRGLGRRRMYSSDLSMTLSLSRFGVLSGKAKSYSVSASISAAQQDQASWSSSYSDPPERYRYWQTQDVCTGGDRAIVMIYEARGKIFPLGFVLLTMNGTPGVNFTATLSKLAGRAEIETDRESVDAGLARYRGYASYTEDVGPSYTIRTYGGTGWVREDQALPAGVEAFVTTAVGSGESRAAATRLVAMWFDGAEQPQPVRLRVEKSSVMSYPQSGLSVSGRKSVYRATSAVTEFPAVDRTMQASISLTVRGTLSFGEHAVTAEYSESATFAVDMHLEGGEVDVASTHPPGSWMRESVSASLSASGGAAAVWSWALDFALEKEGSQPEKWRAVAASSSGVQAPPVDGVYDLGGASLPDPPSPAVSLSGRQITYHALTGSGDQLVARRPASVTLALRRFANRMFGLQAHSGASDGTLWTFPLSPSGPEEASTAPGVDTLSATTLPYGSHNPITGETVIGHAEPVSWT
ncbi:hypothetical protein D3C78_618940 [compost metagenome]